MDELNEFTYFGLYPWVPKRAAEKLNSAFKATSTAVSKEVRWTHNTSVRATPLPRCGGVGSQNCVLRPQSTHCVGLKGGTPIPRMDIDSPRVTVGWRVVLFGILERRGRCFGLERGRRVALSGYVSSGGPVGGHWIDSVESGTTTKVFRWLVAPGLFLVVSGVLNAWPLLFSPNVL